MKKRKVLATLYFDHPEIWRDIVNNNLRCIHSVFGLNMYDLIDSKSLEDIVNSLHLDIVTNNTTFKFLPPYDKDPPLIQIIESGSQEEIEAHRTVIVDKVSAFINKALKWKVLDLYRRNGRLVRISDDNDDSDPSDLCGRHPGVDEEAFLDMVENYVDVATIIKFLDESTVFSEKRKKVFVTKITGHTSKETAKIHNVSRDYVNYAFNKIKDYILHVLISNRRN